MRYKIIITLLLLSFFSYPFLPLTSQAATTSPDKNIMIDGEIINFIRSFSAVYRKGNVEEYMTFFSPATLENGTIPADKIKANYADIVSRHIVTLHELEISDIRNLGDSATVDAVYNKTLVDKVGGNALLTSGNVRIELIKKGDKIKISAIDYDKNINSNYIIGNEDLLEVSVWKSPELSLSIMVRPDGMISLPLIGEVRADGRTPKELKKEIEEKLREYKQEPIVSIIVKESNSKSIYLTGEITRPGKYPLRSETTLTQAIAMAGGFTQWANQDKIIVIRKSPMNPEGNRVIIKYSDIVSGKNMKANILLKAGDTIIVP